MLYCRNTFYLRYIIMYRKIVEIPPPYIKFFTESTVLVLSKQKYNMKIKIFLNVDLRY